jgi:predicted amidohydrolase
MAQILKIGLVQYSPVWENPAGSINKIEEILLNNNVYYNLLIFPELSLTGFTFNSKELAEDIDGISTKYFIDLAIRKNTHILAGLIEFDNDKYYNCLIHIDKKGLIRAKYRKIHPFSFAGEDKYYSSSTEPIITKIDDIKIGLSICYDLRFPELYRLYAKDKPDILVNIANWPQKRIEHWKLLTKARALENLSFFIGVNRVGTDPGNEYNGCSTIVNPLGELLINYRSKEEIIYSEIDIKLIESTRNQFSFLNDIKLI